MAEESEDIETQTLNPTQDTPQTQRKKKHKNKRKRETLSAKLQVITTDQGNNINKSLPLIGYFPSGYTPSSSSSSINQNPPPGVKVLENKKWANRKELVVSPVGSKVDFVGKSYSGEAKNPQACTLALGVLDKETNVLKIVPIASNKIFRLEPRVRGSDSSEKEATSMLTAEVTAEEKANRIRELNQLYGTKKTITRAKKMEALHQTEDPESKEDLDKKIRGITINKDALESSAATATDRNVPPYDLSASMPQLAYPLDKIILKGEWDYLLDIHKLSEAGDQVPLNVYPAFVCNRFHKLQEIEDEAERVKLASIFSYVTHLVKFKDQHSMDASSAKNHKIPSILRQRFSTLFAESDSRRLSDEKRALLISYVLVLTLFADDFQTDLSDIAKDLRMSVVQLRTFAEHLGCKYVPKNMSISLSVPLKFPKPRQRRTR